MSDHDRHIVPRAGPEHRLTGDCWCRPDIVASPALSARTVHHHGGYYQALESVDRLVLELQQLPSNRTIDGRTVTVYDRVSSLLDMLRQAIRACGES